MAESFGEKPTPTAPPPVRQPKQSNPVGDQTRLRRHSENVAIVDIDREIAVTVLYSTVVFKPNQRLLLPRDKRLVEVAEANGIPLRYPTKN